MATGKKAKDIFKRTIGPANLGTEVERAVVRQKPTEPQMKITLYLFHRQVVFLERIALEILERTGKRVGRAEMIRALVDQAADKVNPNMPAEEFRKALQTILPERDLGES